MGTVLTYVFCFIIVGAGFIGTLAFFVGFVMAIVDKIKEHKEIKEAKANGTYVAPVKSNVNW